MSAPVTYTAGANGAIVASDVAPPVEPAKLPMAGSAITAATANLSSKITEHAGAAKNLKAPLKGGGNVVVTPPPNMVHAAGGTDPKQLYANMMKLEATAGANRAYDGLGNAPPQRVGGKRRKSSKYNARRIRKNTRKHSRASRKHRRVRHTRRRVQLYKR